MWAGPVVNTKFARSLMGADAGLIYLYDFVLETSRAMLAFSIFIPAYRF